MSADASVYAVLGLEPGADRAAIEAAYKKLIKRYHPDRKGGNAARAAEINRAYSELRERREQEWVRDAPVDLAEAIYARRARPFRPVKRRPSPWPAYFVLALLGVGVTQRAAIESFAFRLEERFHAAMAPDLSYAASSDRLDRMGAIAEPLHQPLIEQSIRDARRLLRRRDASLAEEHSRECHGTMRQSPDSATLDRCAAFDIAVVAMSRRDPLQDKGPFSVSAVTARQMMAARLLSDDYNAIEDRLDGIRDEVELILAPPPDAVPVILPAAG